MIADVALPQRRFQVFTYRIPPHLQNRVEIGNWVLVPFGRTTLEGIVFAFPQNIYGARFPSDLSCDGLREIAELLDSSAEGQLPTLLFGLANQVSNYYLAPAVSGLRLVLPPSSVSRIAKRIVLTDSGKKVNNVSKLNSEQSKILSRLQKSPKGLTLSSLKKIVEDSGKVISSFKRRGWVQERRIGLSGTDVHTRPIGNSLELPYLFRKNPKQKRKDLGNDRNRKSPTNQGDQGKGFATHGPSPRRLPEWWDDFKHNLTKQRYKEWLLTVPYEFRLTCLLQAVQEMSARQRSCLVLAPEITQAQEISSALETYSGARVALYHGELSQKRRKQLWEQIREGLFDVVVGTRSALFVPIPMGMLWVENEEDTSFKEEHSPYYHARDVARMRARLENAVLILGSSHPSLETFHRLSDRFSFSPEGKPTKSAAAPPIQIVNLRETPYGTILSEAMIVGMQQVLDAKGRVILYLNRKGFSRALTCRDCGYVPLCASCCVTLAVSKKPSSLICSHCGQSQPISLTCPSCSSFRLESVGLGTERIEECVRQQFPSAHVARFDGYTVKTQKDGQSLFRQFQQGDIHILIGTELLIHQREIPAASFIGVPYADAGLHNPDFRSSERTYHLLSKVLLLRDIARDHSQTIIQTYLPTHHVICALAQHDQSIFYEQELSIRQALDYPPFSNVIQVALSGKDQESVQRISQTCGDMLRQRVTSISSSDDASKSRVESILGPIPALRPRHQGRYRHLILVKSHNMERDRQIVRETQQELEGRLKTGGLAVEVNVDPIEIQ